MIPVCITILAHNEERRILRCLESLPLGDDGVAIHVVVNGSSDATARIASEIAGRAGNMAVHDYPEGGKARSWNRFVMDGLAAFHPVHVFVDGDAIVAPRSVAALAAALAENPVATIASGFPLNGRSVARYQAGMRAECGMFGDLYAVRGAFLARMKAAGLRLPDDLIGDDSLLGALAKTDLGDERQWDDARILPVEGAGFYCQPVSLGGPASWRLQYRRMVNYSVRHFQNAMITRIMRGPGPGALPRCMAELYAAELPAMRPRPGLTGWFDRKALAKMRAAMRPAPCA